MKHANNRAPMRSIATANPRARSKSGTFATSGRPAKDRALALFTALVMLLAMALTPLAQAEALPTLATLEGGDGSTEITQNEADLNGGSAGDAWVPEIGDLTLGELMGEDAWTDEDDTAPEITDDTGLEGADDIALESVDAEAPEDESIEITDEDDAATEDGEAAGDETPEDGATPEAEEGADESESLGEDGIEVEDTSTETADAAEPTMDNGGTKENPVSVTTGIDVWNGGWFEVTETVTIDTLITVSGNVHLVLSAGKLTASKGIYVRKGQTLTISGSGELIVPTGLSQYQAGIGGNNQEDAGDIFIEGGTITVNGGSEAAGIGGGGNHNSGRINISGGTVTANGGSNAAGIGGGNCGDGKNITISGGSVTAIGNTGGAGIGGGANGKSDTINISGSETDVNATGGIGGAGIGGGSYRGGEEITIEGGTVRATGGRNAAGIGGGVSGNGGTIKISGGEIVSAKGGAAAAGIGGGSGGAGGQIEIIGGTITAANGGDSAAGIGGGNGGNGGKITISGGTITANGDQSGAGIGGGNQGNGGEITISGGSVTAQGGENAAGIGGGYSYSNQGGDSGTINITGGQSISAHGGNYGAGIGGGRAGNGYIINISGGEAISAIGGDYGAGIGGGGKYNSRGGDGGAITISGGTITAAIGGKNAAGIGGGKSGAGGTIEITNAHIENASGGSSGAGIGGGENGAGGSITINSNEITATGGNNAAGIGGGSGAAGGSITINGGGITATGTSNGAGIGGGYQGNGGTVEINGGTVTATGSSAIGAGYPATDHGSLTLYAGAKVLSVNKRNGTGATAVEAKDDGRVKACHNNYYAQISTCNHENSSYSDQKPDTHVKACNYCLSSSGETAAHVFDDSGVCACGVVKVSYVDAEGNDKGSVPCLPITNSTTEIKETDDWRWFAVKETVSNTNRIQVSGAVNLILCDGATLTASQGIQVSEGNSLTIWGQQNDTGELSATGSVPSGYAGIGGNGNESVGTIIVNGGKITAKGGRNGAGIGGGEGGNGGNFTINRGTITEATGGQYAAGIGGGKSGNGGTITINGGHVTANGGKGDYSIYAGAGIGGGSSGSGDTININGGTVVATGGSSTNNTYSGAGIGGGGKGAGGTINITSGTVTANGGTAGSYNGAGIGGGGRGACGTISITGGSITASGGTASSFSGAGIGSDGYVEGGSITISDSVVNATKGIGGSSVTVSLDYTDTISVTSDSYKGTVELKKTFKDQNTDKLFLKGTPVIADLANTTLVPGVAYTITVDNTISNGTVTASVGTAGSGDTVTLTANPATGYVLNEFKVTYANGVDVTVTDNKFIMPAASVTVTASFNAIVYNITVGSTTNGSVTASPKETTYNNPVTLTVTPATGYELNTLTVTDANNNDITVTGNSFTMPAANVTVSATFKATEYTITLDYDGGAPADIESFNYTVESWPIILGSNFTKEGYTFAGWTGTDLSGPAMTVTIPTGSTGNRAYKATWAAEYSIAVTTPANGTLTASVVKAKSGETVTLTATPDEGYELDKYTVTDANGTNVTVTGNSFTMPAVNVTVSATFKLKPVEHSVDVSAAAVTGGSVTASTNEAKSGDTVTVAATPEAGYRLATVTVTTADGASVALSDDYSFTMPDTDVTVSATFEPIEYSIALNLAGGAATGNPTGYTVESDAIALVNPTREGYDFAGWTGTGIDGTAMTVTIPKGSTGDRTYTATWTEKSQQETPQQETPQQETPQQETPQQDTPDQESPQQEESQPETPQLAVTVGEAVYNGHAQTPQVTVTLGGEALTQGEDYTVALSGECRDAGDYTVTVVVGDRRTEATFTIRPRTVGLAWGDTQFTYDGEIHTPVVTATGLCESDEPVRANALDTCVVTVVGGQRDAGSYVATATALSNGNYALPEDVEQAFTIAPKALGSDSITLKPSHFLWDGKAKTPAVIVRDGDKVVPAAEYTLRYADNVKPGVGRVILKDVAGGNYTVAGTATFEIVKIGEADFIPTLTAVSKRGLKLTWPTVAGAEGYDLYLGKCGSSLKRVKTVAAGSTSWTRTGLAKATDYRAQVRAWRMEDGKKVYILSSPMVYAYTGNRGDRHSNARCVKVEKSSLRLAVGSRATLRASVKLVYPKLKPTARVATLRYFSTDESVATVSKKGVVTARGKGTCNIVIVAANGVRKTVKIKVTK